MRTMTLRTALTRLLPATLLIAAFTTAGMPSGRASACGIFGCDRPGTPNQISARAIDYRTLGLSLNNTATETVVFEFEETQQGPGGARPVSVPPVHLCWYASDGYGATICNDPTQDPTPGYLGHPMDLTSDSVLQPMTRYCFRARARDWNDGDPGSGYVSEDWSAWACATTPAPPPAPAPTPAPARPATPALSLLSQAPAAVRITWTNADPAASGYVVERKHASDSWYDVVGHNLPLAPLGQQMSFTDHPAPGDTDAGLVSYRVCAFNERGEVCSDYATIDILP